MCYSAMVYRDTKILDSVFKTMVRTDLLDLFEERSRKEPKLFPALADRIFPGSYALVSHLIDGERALEPMRYGAYPPFWAADKKIYSTFNARRDNLESKFWSEAFMLHHGFLVFSRFYEWVAVANLLKAGVIKIADVKAEFARQAEERKTKLEAGGKKYKPTPTELKDPRFRQIIIEFTPRDEKLLVAPVIISKSKLPDGTVDLGFAIVTDEPLPDVEAAGYDRSPVMLSSDAIDDWLDVQRKNAADLGAVLSKTRKISFTHALPIVA